MATYKIDITLDEGQDKVLKRVATDRETSAQEIVQSLSPTVVAQIDQWIQDRVNSKLSKLSKADVLARLEYFDSV